MKTDNLWDLFHSHFIIGQELMLLDSDDKVYIGKYIGVSDDGITLKTVFLGKQLFFDWTDIRFLGHDGFPIRKVFGADGSHSLEKEFKKGNNAIEIIRAATCEELKPKEQEPKPKQVPKKQATPVRRIFGGCPWMIDECEARIVNPGNSLQTHPDLWHGRYLDSMIGVNYEGTEWEEALILTAPNGAIGQLFDFESIHHFDVSQN